MIKENSLKLLEKLINHGLFLDPEMETKISPLEGKSIKIIINPPHISFFIAFHHKKLNLSTASTQEPDTIIESSPSQFIRLSVSKSQNSRPNIRLTGCPILAQELQSLLSELDIDWESYLAEFTGDLLAHQLGTWFKSCHTYTKQIQSSFIENLSEFIHEESRLSPPPEELNDFYNDVDQISLETERLEAKLHYLFEKNQKHENN